jgi:hypothetical protein
VHLEIDQTWDGRPARPDERVTLALTRETGHWRLEIDAPFHADPPPPGPPGPTPALWEHEVVELFLWAPSDHYLELELGPHGHHLVLELRGVRRIEREALTIEYRALRSGSRWHGLARIPDALVPPRVERLGAFAIHGSGAGRRYLALAPLPGSAPDFHRPEHFVALPPNP